MLMYTYVATAITTAVCALLLTYMYYLVANFHPIPKPCSFNPQIHFSEVVLDHLKINKHTTLWKGSGGQDYVQLM